MPPKKTNKKQQSVEQTSKAEPGNAVRSNPDDIKPGKPKDKVVTMSNGMTRIDN